LIQSVYGRQGLSAKAFASSQGFRQHRRVLLTPGEALLKQVIRMAPKAQAVGPSPKAIFFGF
jgi:hypothetical protein